MKRIFGTAAGIALLVMLAACGSTKSGAHPTAVGHVTGVSGTEVIQGAATGKAAVANTTRIPLALSGPVTATDSKFILRNSKKKSQVFVTPAGDLAVTHSLAKEAVTVTGSAVTRCVFRQVGRGTYVVVGAKSTGKFEGATGHGTYVVTFTAQAKRLSAAKPCSQGNIGNPLAAGASVVFLASGHLTRK